MHNMKLKLLIYYDESLKLELNDTYICYSFSVLSYDRVLKSRRVRQQILVQRRCLVSQ